MQLRNCMANHCLQYQIYVIPKNVNLLNACAFASGPCYFIVMDPEPYDKVAIEEKSVATKGSYDSQDVRSMDLYNDYLAAIWAG